MIDRNLTSPPPVEWVAQTALTRARPATTVEPAAAAVPARDDARGRMAASQRALIPLPDPDRPTGPPPTFAANVLESERERLRKPADEARPADGVVPPYDDTPMKTAARTVDLAL